MKLILTEEQYKVLERILSEAIVPIKSKIEVGGFMELVYLVGDDENSDSIKITNIIGGGKYIEGMNKDGKYIINLGGALDIINNTFTLIKNGKYVNGPQGPNIVGGTKVKVKYILKLNISDANKNKVDEIYTELGSEQEHDKKGKEDEFNQSLKDKSTSIKDKEEREKRIYQMVMDNPRLKKAFYHQPSLLNGLIKFGKAKGIAPAQALLDKYVSKINGGDSNTKNTDFNDFKVNKSVMFEVKNKPVLITYGLQNLKLDVGRRYTARYVGKQYLKGKIDGVVFKIYMKENKGDDIYSGGIKAFFKEDNSIVVKKDNITIIIKDYNY